METQKARIEGRTRRTVSERAAIATT
jgi:hypothetical protein